MPFVETRFVSPTTLTTSASLLYVVPTNCSAIVKQLVVTNTTGTAATFTFYIGSAIVGNAVFSGTSVGVNDTVIINLSQVLSTGETLRALASTNSAINITVSGVLNDGPIAPGDTYIPYNAITSDKIATAAVGTDEIATSAVTSDKIATGSITVDKMADQIVLPKTNSYIVANSDKGKLAVMNNGAVAVTITVNSATAFAVGQRTDFIGVGNAATVTFVASGVSIFSTPGLKLRASGSAATLICIISGVYVLVGDLSA